jgi:hypothetical protein
MSVIRHPRVSTFAHTDREEEQMFNLMFMMGKKRRRRGPYLYDDASNRDSFKNRRHRSLNTHTTHGMDRKNDNRRIDRHRASCIDETTRWKRTNGRG